MGRRSSGGQRSGGGSAPGETPRRAESRSGSRRTATASCRSPATRRRRHCGRGGSYAHRCSSMQRGGGSPAIYDRRRLLGPVRPWVALKRREGRRVLELVEEEGVGAREELRATPERPVRLVPEAPAAAGWARRTWVQTTSQEGAPRRRPTSHCGASRPSCCRAGQSRPGAPRPHR